MKRLEGPAWPRGSDQQAAAEVEPTSRLLSERVRLAQRAKGATSSFLPYVWRRFQADGCTGVAAGLSYTSLLAIVPMLAIGLAMFAAFPPLADLRDDFIIILAQNLAPDLASCDQRVSWRLHQQRRRYVGCGCHRYRRDRDPADQHNPDRVRQDLGCHHARHKLHRFPVYWALITLGPLLFGASLSISTYVFSVADNGEFYGLSAGLKILDGNSSFSAGDRRLRAVLSPHPDAPRPFDGCRHRRDRRSDPVRGARSAALASICSSSAPIRSFTALWRRSPFSSSGCIWSG